MQIKNWQDLKDTSYINIKNTKSKNIQQGITKHKIFKLSRANSVYEHYKYHEMKQRHHQSKTERCKTCTDTTRKKKTERKVYPIKINANLSFNTSQIEEQQKTKRVLLFKSKTCNLDLKKKVYNNEGLVLEKKHSQISLKKKSSHQYPQTQKQTLFTQIDLFKTIIGRFDKQVKSTHHKFDILQKTNQKQSQHFLTAVQNLQYQLDEDKQLTIAKVETERIKMLKDQRISQKKRVQREKIIKQMENQKIDIPFSMEQLQNIWENSLKKNNDESKKLKGMMTSLYEYKTKTNFYNKKKIVKKFINKEKE